jgi:signal transduction histidine kinase
MTLRDVTVLIGLAAGASAFAAVVGALLLRRVGSLTVRSQALVIALCSLFTMIAGVLFAAKEMFISTHDLEALLVVMAVATAVAAGAAVQLGSDIGRGTRHVGALARALVDEHDTAVEAPLRAPADLTALAAQLSEASRRLAEVRSRERALESSRRELIAWVSHDLRSPIAAVRAMAEALDDCVVDDADTVRHYHHQIRADAERLTALVDDLFELSRIHSGTMQIRRERICLHDVVADALFGARTHARFKGVTIIDRLDTLPSIDVAAPELTRVLHNLLDNAIRHTPAGGQVVVESGADERGALLSVFDECGGIPAPDLDRVFDVAFRGDLARAKDGRGGGLGLAIAKGLVEAHDGSIEVVNHRRGCQFTVRLPVPA